MYMTFVTALTVGAMFGALVPWSTSNDLEMSMFVVETSPAGPILRCTLGTPVNCTRLEVNAPFARSVVYDPVGDHVYWTYMTFINRIRSSGENYEHKWFQFDSKPSVVAIDHSSRLLFALSYTRSSTLRSVSLQTRHQTELPATGNRLWGLAVDALMKNIFLAEATRIFMMRYDGTARQELLAISADYFVAMTYDPEGQRLYYNLWTMRTFGSLNIHTRNATVHSSSFNNQYPSMTLFEGVLYVTEYNEREKVFKILRNGTPSSDIPIAGSKSGFSRIAVFRKYGCSPGWFSRTCSLACGQCLAGSACDHESGYCTQGCDVGWTGRTCKTESEVRSRGSVTTSPHHSQDHTRPPGWKQGRTGTRCAEGQWLFWTLVGGYGPLGLLVCALVVAVVRYKRKLTRLEMNKEEDTRCMEMGVKTYQEYLTAQDADGESADNMYEVI